jgi:hypothetical protein
MGRRWKPVKCYTNGELREYRNYRVNKDADIVSITGKVISKSVNKGYYVVNLLNDKTFKRDRVSVSRLILTTFRGIPENKDYTADHIKSHNSLDNRLRNLRWATRTQQLLNQRPPSRCKNAIPIYRIDSKGYVEDFTSLSDASRKIGTNSGGIHAWLTGRKKCSFIDTHGGKYSWHYADEAPDLEKELWVEVFDSGVFVSQLGRVKDARRNRIHKKYAKEYLTELSRTTYPSVKVANKNWKIHMLVALHLFPLTGDFRDNGYVVDHINRCTTDASANNLRIVSSSENCKNR